MKKINLAAGREKETPNTNITVLYDNVQIYHHIKDLIKISENISSCLQRMKVI